jgi:hypothetical protein
MFSGYYLALEDEKTPNPMPLLFDRFCCLQSFQTWGNGARKRDLRLHERILRGVERRALQRDLGM